MNCTKCGTMNEDNRDVCSNCGAELKNSSEQSVTTETVNTENATTTETVATEMATSAEALNTQKEKKSNKMPIIAVGVIALIAIVVFLVFNKKDSLTVDVVMLNSANQIQKEQEEIFENNEVITTLFEAISGNFEVLVSETTSFEAEDVVMSAVFTKLEEGYKINYDIAGFFQDEYVVEDVPFEITANGVEMKNGYESEVEELVERYTKEFYALANDNIVSNEKSSEYDREIKVELPADEIVDIAKRGLEEYYTLLIEVVEADYEESYEKDMLIEQLEVLKQEAMVELEAADATGEVIPYTIYVEDTKVIGIAVGPTNGEEIIIMANNVDSYYNNEYSIVYKLDGEEQFNVVLALEFTNEKWAMDAKENNLDESFGFAWELTGTENNFEVYLNTKDSGEMFETATFYAQDGNIVIGAESLEMNALIRSVE